MFKFMKQGFFCALLCALFALPASSSGVKESSGVTEYTLEQALALKDTRSSSEEYQETKPPPGEEGWVPTWSHKGPAWGEGIRNTPTERFTQDILQSHKDKSVLVLGGGRGRAMKEVLEAKPLLSYNFLALTKQDLYLTAKEFSDSQTEESKHPNLRLLLASAVDEYEIGRESHDRILLESSAWPFIGPDHFDDFLKKCHEGLKPGGRIYGIAPTPNLAFFREDFAEHYAEQARKGEPFPGWIKPEDWIKEDQKKASAEIIDIKEYLMVVTPDVLKSKCASAGFVDIESKECPWPTKSPMFSMPEGSEYADRELVYVIARKP